ncbi:helix-turn-helix domain-containing protein [Enterobacter ludwigii]|uniref:helix-turn-helix domain-containing protein n=1 Tax=Enterobacter ludwigii TaxID=299767 RepID=UPI003BF9DD17
MTRINEAPLAPVEVMQGVDMSGVGERIRDARVSRRMTHKELEEAAGLPDGVISVWEFRKAYPPDEAFDKLAKALNTSVTWLLTGREIARES